MDEADILGDRIAIMAEGTLKCAGSSHFLKQKFGVGYILTLVKSAEGSSPIPTRVKELTAVVVKYVPGSSLVSDVGSEVHYEMPFSACAHLPALLTELDRSISNGERLSICEYGVSITTLEEVFIKVAHMDEMEDVKPLILR
jgi:hypothetical protein